MKKRGLIILLLLELLLLPVFAVGHTLQLSSPTTVVGSEFLVRLQLKDSFWGDAAASSVSVRLLYDSSELEYMGAYGGLGSPQVEFSEGELRIFDQGAADIYSLRLHFKALTVCTSSLEMAELTVYDPGGAALDCALSSGTVTILQSGDDSSLFHLGVVPGTLVPAFSPEITHYELLVPSDTVGVQVTARPNGYYATAFVEGHWNLREGHNPVTIDMTSGGGCSALYTIDVNRDAPVRIPAAWIDTAPSESPETPAPTATPEPSPTPAPTPAPTPEPLIRDSEETLKALEKAKGDMVTAQKQADSALRTAKTVVVVCMAEFLLIVLLALYIWKNIWGKGRKNEENN